ncbi:glycosyltransferase [Ruegeria sp. HKCCSP335]|uniref:glycosyltransferase n=1 Tax=Ruegeria sp. HKCCSP335 TaxID=2794833 RepID=UPI001AE7E594|nr:glycosyltransferase [Ruegeria sp. HKCCSP335]
MRGTTLPELATLQNQIRNALAIRNIASALDSVRWFVDSILTNPRAITRVLGSEELDALCQDIAEEIKCSVPRDAADRSGTVIIASELSRAGGHEQVMADIVNLNLFDSPVTILLTDCFDRADAAIAEEFAAFNQVEVTTVQGVDSAARLDSVCKYLCDKAPENLLLFFHHQDTIGFCAALAAGIPNTIFVHHADHHLSLGVTCKQFRHVDLANMAFENCRHDFGITDNIYWPLILRNDVGVQNREFNKNHCWRSCSVGRADKFAANGYAFDYASLLPKILKATGGTHVHIGPLSTNLSSSIEKSFVENGVPLDRVKFISYAPSVAQALIDENVDVFLGSFPTGGGKSTIEAMAAGIPLLMHQNYRHRMFCGADVAYPGALTWQTEEELFEVLAGLSPEILSDHASRSRACFERNHSSDALVSAIKSQNCVPPPLIEHPVNQLFFFLDEERDWRASEESRLVAENKVLALEAEVAELEAEVAELEGRLAGLEEKLTSPRKLSRELARQLNRRLHGKRLR